MCIVCNAGAKRITHKLNTSAQLGDLFLFTHLTVEEVSVFIYSGIQPGSRVELETEVAQRCAAMGEGERGEE